MSYPIELRCFDLIRKRVRSEYAGRMPTRGPEYYGAEFDVRPYTDAKTMAADWLLFNLLRKWEGWEASADAKAKAIATWKSCEAKCFETNCRIRSVEPHLRGEALTFIRKVRGKIRQVLGPCDELEMFKQCRWSKGATFAHKRGVVPFEKQKLRYDVTEPSMNRARYALWDLQTREVHGTDDLEFQVVRGNRCVNVPKTAKTDRMIAAEPSANAFMQQAVGRYIRHRLKRVGINLESQEANQDGAFRAVVDGLATVDLSSASDTISRSVVELLLPSEWFELLSSLRSPYSLLDGKWHCLEKFSSMGNAFTFELETLLFWALARVISGDGAEVLVYGDDIIIPQDKYQSFVECLTFFGFEVNKEKSFHEGSFFESCGKHFFDLEDVTPVYQKRRLHSKSGKPKPEEYIRFHNRLYRWGVRTGCLHLVKDALNLLVSEMSKMPVFKKTGVPRIPFSVMDTGVLTDPSWFKLRPGRSDYVLWQWVTVTRKPSDEDLRRASDHKSNLGALSLKLRDPNILNGGRDGHIEIPRDTFYKLKRRVFWASAILC